MKQLFALLLTAIVAITSPAVLAGDKGKGEEKSAMKGENASEMGKAKRAEGKAKAEANKEAAKAKAKGDDEGDDDEDEDDDE
jgi:hypothetical protein